MSEISRKLIHSGNCIASNEVIAEVIYVLNKVYKIDREDIKNALLECLKKLAVQNFNIMKNAIIIYSERKFDFVDCLLASQAMIAGDEIYTFDKKLENYIQKSST